MDASLRLTILTNSPVVSDEAKISLSGRYNIYE